MSNIKNSANIYELSLISKNGDYVNLINIFVSFNIYESIFSHFITGDLILKDTSDLIKNLPIIGGEQIFLTFGDRTNTKMMYFDLCVIGEPTQIGASTGKDKVEMIYLKLVSKLFIHDNFQRINMRLKSSKSDIVESITNTFWKSDKKIVGNVTGDIELIANNWLPSQVIDYICNQSKDAMFFETNDVENFTFDTVSNLLQKSPETELYLASNFEKSIGLNHVLTYKFDTKFDLKNSYMTSMFGQTVYKPSLENYGYEKKNKSLDEILGSELPLMDSNKLFNESLSTQDNNISLTYEDIDSKLYRNMIIQTLQHYNLLVMTRGSSERKVGNTINFNMPSIDNAKELNANFSGKWLITQLKHSVSSDMEYKQNLRLWKNSFANNRKV